MATNQLSAKWEIVRSVLKEHDGTLHQRDDGTLWLLMPIDPEAGAHVLSHPGIVVDDDSDRLGDSQQSYRWRSRAEPPARKILLKALNGRGVQ